MGEKMNKVLISHDGLVTKVILNRPEKRNALDFDVLHALSDFFSKPDLSRRLVVLSSEGSDFSSGVDLNWMSDADEADGNKASSLIASLYSAIRAFPKPIIARTHGRALAGGVGLLSACDFVVATGDASFAIPEVRTGLVPAIMAPVLVERIGISRFKSLSLTGRTIGANEALSIGLVDALDDLNNPLAFESIVADLLKAGPYALATTKKICSLISFEKWNSLSTELVEVLASTRKGLEAKEGIAAFLEHRQTVWVGVSK